MRLITEKLNPNSAEFQTAQIEAKLILPFEVRQKARFVAQLTCPDNNDEEVDLEEVGLQLERGKILRNGDKLRAEDGAIIEIIAGDEDVSTVHCDDQKTLARVCYHLGNRHVPLQVESNWCRFLHDHVLNEMVELLGATVVSESAPFEPEAGAYAHGSHARHSHGSHAALSDDSKPSVNSIDGIGQFEAI